jgi:hypothetical protein
MQRKNDKVVGKDWEVRATVLNGRAPLAFCLDHVRVVPMAALARSMSGGNPLSPAPALKLIPVSIFTEDAGPPKGAAGRRFSRVTTEQVDPAVSSKPGERLACHFSCEAGAIGWQTVQTGNTPFLRGV